MSRSDKLRGTVTYQLAHDKFTGHGWILGSEDMLRIQLIMQRLYYDIETMNPDEMRDCAHKLGLSINRAIEHPEEP